VERIEYLTEELQKSRITIDQLKFNIEEQNTKIITMEEQFYEMETTQLDLLNQLKDMEFSNDQLEHKIELLIKANKELEKGQAVYIGHKEDKIDKAVAKYVNKKFPEKGEIGIMFLRESEGVYQFGQRRVHVKVERGDQVLVRVGGGFMHIDEFVEQFTDSELEKVERRDVLSRFQNKIAVQNIAAK
jgi:hypothetical protein